MWEVLGQLVAVVAIALFVAAPVMWAETVSRRHRHGQCPGCRAAVIIARCDDHRDRWFDKAPIVLTNTDRKGIWVFNPRTAVVERGADKPHASHGLREHYCALQRSINDELQWGDRIRW